MLVILCISIALLAFIQSTIGIGTFLASFLAIGFIMSIYTPKEKFDTRKELKRVCRGEGLPEETKEKKTWIGKAVDRAVASVAGEVVAAVGIKKHTETNYIAFKIIVIELNDIAVDSENNMYIWIGAFGKYHFLPNLLLPIILFAEKTFESFKKK